MTVNHQVTGSSPVWGAIIEFPFRESLKRGFFVLRLVPFTFPILVKKLIDVILVSPVTKQPKWKFCLTILVVSLPF